MHGGNTNEAAATLFDWQAQSPALLKDLEDQGAKAIMHAGREGRSSYLGKYWECACGRAHVQGLSGMCVILLNIRVGSLKAFLSSGELAIRHFDRW